MEAHKFIEAQKLLVLKLREQNYTVVVRDFKVLDLDGAMERFSCELLIEQELIKLANLGSEFYARTSSACISRGRDIDTIMEDLLLHLQIEPQEINIQQVTKDNIHQLLDEIWPHYQQFIQSQDDMIEELDTGVDFGGSPYTNDYLLDKFHPLVIDRYTLTLLRHQDEIQGFIGYAMKDDFELRIKDLWVHPTCRGLGRATMLLNCALEAAKKMGALAMSLSAISSNEQAISVYEHAGFKVHQVQMIKKV